MWVALETEPSTKKAGTISRPGPTYSTYLTYATYLTYPALLEHVPEAEHQHVDVAGQLRPAQEVRRRLPSVCDELTV